MSEKPIPYGRASGIVLYFVFVALTGAAFSLGWTYVGVTTAGLSLLQLGEVLLRAVMNLLAEKG